MPAGAWPTRIVWWQTVDVENRVDRVSSYGGGIGYRTGHDLRLAFTVDKSHRTSEIDNHEYDDLRYGLTVTYGLQ